LNSHYDVIIIGGGPAASAAASHASQAGLDVCVIEREDFPRDHPGESLHPGVEPILKQLNVMDDMTNAGFLRFDGINILWGDKYTFQAFKEDKTWLGFQAYRRVFDNIMLKNASNLGATVKLKCSAQEIVYSPSGKMIGLIAGDELLTAPYFIDASGNWQWLARQLDIPYKTYSKTFYVRYGYVSGSCPKYDANPYIQSDHQGWTWIARVAENTYQWTRFLLDKEHFSEVRSPPKELSALKSIGAPRGADMTWRIAERVAGPGFFLTGDAAAILDPASSHGVLKALMSGIYAADMIINIAGGKCTEEKALTLYQNWVMNWFQSDVVRLNEFYQQILN
jgi:flavin-dependent dehydrogenase